MQGEGYTIHRWDGPQSFPYVITIFSAPNYCGYYENKASVLIIDRGNLSLKQYEETEPPYRLPDNMDVFSWSVPFLAEKVTNMLFNLVKKSQSDIVTDDVVDLEKVLKEKTPEESNEEEKKKRQIVMRGKISSVAKMTRMFSTLREESEMLLQIKNISPDGKLPRGILLQGKPAIKNGNTNSSKDMITLLMLSSVETVHFR